MDVKKLNNDVKENSVYTDDNAVRPDVITRIEDLIEAEDSTSLKELVEPLHESELGDILEALDSDERASLVSLTEGDFDYASLTEVDEAVRLEVSNPIEMKFSRLFPLKNVRELYVRLIIQKKQLVAGCKQSLWLFPPIGQSGKR